MRPVDQIIRTAPLHQSQLVEIVEVTPVIVVEIVVVDVVIISRAEWDPGNPAVPTIEAYQARRPEMEPE